MATYLPNSDDYIAKTKAYTPDFKFLADVLGRRQDRYNTNYKHLNQLYGRVVHADLSHKDNIHKRDEYANLLVPKIQQLTGTDFSLQQNADAAKALFKPFFEDKTLVRDIVFTKRFNNEMNKADNYRKSPHEEERDRWWQAGVDRLNFSMDDFKSGSLEESMSEPLPEYVEDPDLIERGLEYLKNYLGEGKGMEITDVIFSPDKKWMTTMTNGTVLTNRPTGIVDKETGLMGTYNPAANLIAKTITDDPIIARGYATKIYVDTRKFYEDEKNIEKYGSQENAEKYYLNEVIKNAKKSTEESIESENVQKKEITKTKNSWAKFLEKNPGANKEATQNYLKAIAEITAIEEGIKKDNQIMNDINREYQDISELRNIAYQAYMNYSISADIQSAANEYAQSTMKVTKRELNPIYEKQLDFQYKQALEQQRFDNEKALADYKESLKPTGLDLDGPGMQSGSPDATINVSQYENTGDLIGDNRAYNAQFNRDNVLSPMFNTIERMNVDLANVWSDADLTIDPTGIEVEVFVYNDGSGYMKDDNPTNKQGKWQKKFLLWPEARAYLVDGIGKEQTDLEDYYNEVLQRYHHQVSLGDEGALEPMLGTAEFNDLNTLISQMEDKVRMGKATLIDIVEKGNKTYKTAYDRIIATSPSLEAYFEKYGSPIIGEGDEVKLLTLAQYQKSVRENFRQKIDAIGLPPELKGIEDFGGSADQFMQYIGSIFTPDALQTLGVDSWQQAIKENYLMDMTEWRNNKPNSRMSDEVWNKSVDATMDNFTNSYLRNGRSTDKYGRRAYMRLQDRVQRYSEEDWRPDWAPGAGSGPYNSLNDESKTAYMNLYDAMNQGMTSSVAGSGFPTYSARNEYMMKDQTDDGSLVMTDDWNGQYIHGSSHPEVEQQMLIAFNAINNLDKSLVSVKSGTPQSHGVKGILTDGMTWDVGMTELIDQIRMDLREAPSASNKPNINITYNENLNGKSGWTFQLDQEYITKLRSNSSTANKLLPAIMDDNNTFTIYVEKGLIENPLDIVNMNISNTRRIIKTEGHYQHTVPMGGHVKSWVGSDGQTIYTQITEGYWHQNPTTKEWEYKEKAGQAVPLPISEGKIDEMMRTSKEHLEELANKNRILQDKNTQ